MEPSFIRLNEPVAPYVVSFKRLTMLHNVSYNNKKIEALINQEVGNSFGWFERLNLGGIGSPKLSITGASMNIHELLNLDNNLNTCNIELRPKGIIIRFRSILETYALVIPFYKLTLFKGDADSYSIYCDSNLIKVADNSESIRRFIRRVLDMKAQYMSAVQPVRVRS